MAGDGVQEYLYRKFVHSVRDDGDESLMNSKLGRSQKLKAEIYSNKAF